MTPWDLCGLQIICVSPEKKLNTEYPYSTSRQRFWFRITDRKSRSTSRFIFMGTKTFLPLLSFRAKQRYFKPIGGGRSTRYEIVI